MEHGLQRRGVEPTLTGWITSMINNRAVCVSMNLYNIRARLAAGCLKDGVLSPLLWYLLVDDLLPDLQREAGFYAQGYTGNITTLVSGTFEGVVSERMQVALRLAETWHRKSFTWRRKLPKLRCPSVFGSKVLISIEAKYLGVILDSWKMFGRT
ncbi:hypothetical protein Trydic_g9105 [Trypoxylus dichotomus]